MLGTILRISTIAILILSGDTARAETSTDPFPTAAEKLPSAIPLTCSGMTIVEWRSTRQLGELTGPTEKGKEALNQLCHKAIDNFPAFLKKKGLKFEKRDVTLSISMMGGNVTMDGKDPRNLNDVTGRFKTNVTGCCNWGLYLAGSKHLFLRNDPVKLDKDQIVIHRMFARTFLHELSHVLFHQWKVRDLQPEITREQDEGIAEEWVRSLGYPYSPESSGEDRINKAAMLSSPNSATASK